MGIKLPKNLEKLIEKPADNEVFKYRIISPLYLGVKVGLLSWTFKSRILSCAFIQPLLEFFPGYHHAIVLGMTAFCAVSVVHFTVSFTGRFFSHSLEDKNPDVKKVYTYEIFQDDLNSFWKKLTKGNFLYVMEVGGKLLASTMISGCITMLVPKLIEISLYSNIILCSIFAISLIFFDTIYPCVQTKNCSNTLKSIACALFESIYFYGKKSWDELITIPGSLIHHIVYDSYNMAHLSDNSKVGAGVKGWFANISGLELLIPCLRIETETAKD